MNKKLLNKCFVSLGLLLFLTLFLPQQAVKAQALGTEKEATNSYRLNLKSITIVNGKTFTLKVYNLEDDAKVSFKSADPEIASVSEDGIFTANKVGKTKITATVRRGLNPTNLTCDVTVGPPAFSVRIQSRMILGMDQSALLTAIVKPDNTAETAKFSSYDPSIATVSSGGRISAKKPGLTYVFAEIDATNPDGSRKFSSCSVIVAKPEEAPLLEKFFSEHYELGMIPEVELNNALDEFFNGTGAEVNSASQEAEKAAEASLASQKDTPDTTKENTAPITEVSTKAAEAATAETVSTTEALNQFLNDKFDLAGIRQKLDELIQKAAEPQTGKAPGSTAQ